MTSRIQNQKQVSRCIKYMENITSRLLFFYSLSGLSSDALNEINFRFHQFRISLPYVYYEAYAVMRWDLKYPTQSRPLSSASTCQIPGEYIWLDYPVRTAVLLDQRLPAIIMHHLFRMCRFLKSIPLFCSSCYVCRVTKEFLLFSMRQWRLGLSLKFPFLLSNKLWVRCVLLLMNKSK